MRLFWNQDIIQTRITPTPNPPVKLHLGNHKYFQRNFPPQAWRYQEATQHWWLSLSKDCTSTLSSTPRLVCGSILLHCHKQSWGHREHCPSVDHGCWREVSLWNKSYLMCNTSANWTWKCSTKIDITTADLIYTK